MLGHGVRNARWVVQIHAGPISKQNGQNTEISAGCRVPSPGLSLFWPLGFLIFGVFLPWVNTREGLCAIDMVNTFQLNAYCTDVKQLQLLNIIYMGKELI